MQSKYRTVFKRLETDAEFVKRVRERFGKNAIYYTHELTTYKGETLDGFALGYLNMQRRIVEDVA